MKIRKHLVSLFLVLPLMLSSCGETGNASVDNTGKSSDVTRKAYTINFDLNGGKSDSYSGSKNIDSFSDDIFFYDCVKEGYNFRGWSYDGVKIFDEKGNKVSEPILKSEMTFVALYEKNVRLTITMNIPDGGTITGGGIYAYNSYVDVTAVPLNENRFLGWYYQGNLLSTSLQYKYMMWDKDITLEAKFAYKAFNFSVRSNNSEYGLVLVKSEETQKEYSSSYSVSFDYKSKVTVAAYSKTAVRFLGWYDKENNLVSANAVYDLIMPYEDYALEAKWNHFIISYFLNGGENSKDNPTIFSIDDEIVLSDPSRDGYTFAGWYINDIKVEKLEKGTTSDITLEAKWSANLNLLTVTSEDTNKGTTSIISGEGYTDEEITVKVTPAFSCVFKGWYEGNQLLSRDETYTFTMPAGDKSIVAYFWTKEEYNDILSGKKPNYSSETNAFTYGLYPQTHVSDASLISTLDILATTESNGWYLYNGSYYAKKSASPYSSSYTFSDGTEIVDGTTYWFKCEPIEWKVLSSDNGTYSLVSTVLLDAHQYHSSTSSQTIDGKTVYPNNYKYSDIRSWLTNDFYNLAFSLDSSYILTTNVDNSASTTESSTNPYECENTNDKVYLLSYSDYKNASYFLDDASRYCKPTDYAKANGAYYHTSVGSYNGNGWYWTRSPFYNTFYDASYVFSTGNLCDNFVSYTHYGVRPAITIKI